MAEKTNAALGYKNREQTAAAGRKLRVGIIGTGRMAVGHMESYGRMADVEVVAGCDRIPGKAEAFFARCGAASVKTGYVSHKEMLDDESLHLDAVSICTDNRGHAGPAIYALQKGVSVLLEQPFTVTLDEAAEVIKAQRAGGGVLSVGFRDRMDPNIEKIKELVDAGELGRVYYIQTGGGRRRGIPTAQGTTRIENATAGLGVLADIGCAALDAVLYAVGYPKPLAITGYKSDLLGKNPATYDRCPEHAAKFGVEDFAAAFIRLEGNVLLDFRAAWAMNLDTLGDTLILGTEGGLRIPMTDGVVTGPMRLCKTVGGVNREIEVPLIADSDTNRLDQPMRAFLDAVKCGGKSPVPALHMLYNQAILDGISRSAKAGCEIVPEIPEV